MNDKSFDFDKQIARYRAISKEINDLQNERLQISSDVAAFIRSKNREFLYTTAGRKVTLKESLLYPVAALTPDQRKRLRAWCIDNDCAGINMISLMHAIKQGAKPPINTQLTADRIVVSGFLSKRHGNH